MKKILAVRGQQAQDILGLLKCVATGGGKFPLHEVHEQTMYAFAEHLFHTTVDMNEIEGTLDGAAEKVVDKELRGEVMNMAGIIPFLEEEHEEERIETFATLATEFGFSRKFARELHGMCHNAVLELTLCQVRPLGLAMGMPLWKGMLKMGRSFMHLDGDKKLLARYEGFKDLDDGIFGKIMTDYYRDNHFALPGTVGAPFSNSLRIHDMHHVLAGYPTTPIGETCVLAFDSGMMKQDLGKAVIAYVAQFQVGLQFDKGLAAFKNEINPDTVIRAYERGGNCNVNYETYDFDFDSLLEEPLADIRERFNLDPEGAIVKGPGDPWCGDRGIVGMRQDPNKVEKKKTWLEKVLDGKNVVKD
jgi:hypothetical protein